MRTLVASLFVATFTQAATGGLVLKVDRPDGTPCSATVEVRKAGQSSIVKTFTAAGGQGTVGLDAGSYDVKAIAITNKYWQTKRVAIEGGKTVTHRIEVSQPPATSSSGSGTAPAQPAQAIGSEPRIITGKVQSTAPLSGKLVLLLEVGSTAVKSGAFTLSNAKTGKYRALVYEANGKLVATQDLTIGPDTKQITIRAR